MPDADAPKSKKTKRATLIWSVVILLVLGSCMFAIAAPKFGGFQRRQHTPVVVDAGAP